MKTVLILSILVFNLSTTLCQIDTSKLQSFTIFADSTTTMIPLVINDSLWMAMPKSRVGRIANHIDSIEFLNFYLDSALAVCNRLVIGKNFQLNQCDSLAQNYEQEIENKEKSIMALKNDRQSCQQGLKAMQKDNERLRRNNKTLGIGLGATGGALLLTIMGLILF